MAPPSDSAFAIHKVQGNRRSRVKEEEKKKKWGEIFSCWTDKLLSRKPPADNDAHQPPPTDAGAKNANKVFGQPELLGEVLKYVPSENLLTNKQLVNCTWKNAIERTPAIKRKLWKKVNSPTVASPHGTTEWDGRTWPDASHAEMRALTSGIPIYNGVFTVNMLAPPTSSMRRVSDKEQAALDEKFPPPPPAPQCPIKAFRGLIKNNFPSLSFVTTPPVVLRLVKPLDFQTSIEPTPRGQLVNIGFKMPRSLCRGYTLDATSKTKCPAPQPAWLKMQLTDPPCRVGQPDHTRRNPAAHDPAPWPPQACQLLSAHPQRRHFCGRS